eukprot:8618166-Pyramimonas_sp.AAC.1
MLASKYFNSRRMAFIHMCKKQPVEIRDAVARLIHHVAGNPYKAAEKLDPFDLGFEVQFDCDGWPEIPDCDALCPPTTGDGCPDAA